MDPVKYANTLNDRALFCGRVYPESKVMSIFLDVIDPRIVDNVRQYWKDYPHSSLNTLASYASSLRNMIAVDRKFGT